jgi:hypothetical protein
MNVRRLINRLLQPAGYEIAKTFGSQAILNLSPGQELDFQVIASRVSPRRKHVWIVAPPKSGSTWLTMLLKRLLGWPLVPLVGGYDRREQEVDVLQMVRFPDINVLSPHQHCRASQPTVDFIRRFHVKPIVTTRNVLDTVVSLRDHLVRESRAMPMAYVDDQFLHWDDERQYEFVIEMFMPWILSFYASWLAVAPSLDGNLLFVRYEDLVAQTSEMLHSILRYCDETRSESQIAEVIDRVSGLDTRRNQAVTGRGAALLSPAQQAKIQQLREFYQHVDLTAVGL